MCEQGNREDRYIRIWEKAVDTQMHFNDMSVRSRQVGLTFVAAALGLGVVLLSQGEDFSIRLFALDGYVVVLHISVVVVLGATLALLAVMLLDLNVYHQMLRGAVTFGEDFEEKYMKQIFDLEKGMTQAISHFSRYKKPEIIKDAEGNRKFPYSYTGGKEKTGRVKMYWFYIISIIALLFVSIFAFIITNAEFIIYILFFDQPAFQFGEPE